MKKILLCYVSIIFFLLESCKQHSKEETLTTDSVRIHRDSTILLDTTDVNFLSDCDSLEIWQGGIQGVTFSDSTGPFIMAQCFANKYYDVIVYSDRLIDLKEGIDSHSQKSIQEGISGAEYYAFEIPKKLPEEPENEFDRYDYVFPAEVKVYKLFSDGWYLINIQNVHSFEQLGRLKMNSIYKHL